MKLIITTLITAAVLLAQEKPAPKITDAERAEYYQQAAIIARVNAEIAKLSELQRVSQAASAKINALAARKKAEGCELDETIETLQCKPDPAPKHPPKK